MSVQSRAVRDSGRRREALERALDREREVVQRIRDRIAAGASDGGEPTFMMRISESFASAASFRRNNMAVFKGSKNWWF